MTNAYAMRNSLNLKNYNTAIKTLSQFIPKQALDNRLETFLRDLELDI